MSLGINNIHSVNDNEITTPTSTANYPLGTEITIKNANGSLATYKYVLAGGALVAATPYVLDHNGTAVTTAAPATNAGQVSEVGIAQVAFTSGYYGFVCVKGQCEALHIAETYAAGDHLEVLNTGTALVVDGSTGSTTKSEKSVGVTIDAGTTAVAGTVELYGNPVVVAAS